MSHEEEEAHSQKCSSDVSYNKYPRFSQEYFHNRELLKKIILKRPKSPY